MTNEPEISPADFQWSEAGLSDFYVNLGTLDLGPSRGWAQGLEYVTPLRSLWTAVLLPVAGRVAPASFESWRQGA